MVIVMMMTAVMTNLSANFNAGATFDVVVGKAGLQELLQSLSLSQYMVSS